MPVVFRRRLGRPQLVDLRQIDGPLIRWPGCCGGGFRFFERYDAIT